MLASLYSFAIYVAAKEFCMGAIGALPEASVTPITKTINGTSGSFIWDRQLIGVIKYTLSYPLYVLCNTLQYGLRTPTLVPSPTSLFIFMGDIGLKQVQGSIPISDTSILPSSSKTSLN